MSLHHTSASYINHSSLTTCAGNDSMTQTPTQEDPPPSQEEVNSYSDQGEVQGSLRDNSFMVSARSDTAIQNLLIEDPSSSQDDLSSPYSEENLPSVCCSLLGDLHHLSVYTPAATDEPVTTVLLPSCSPTHTYMAQVLPQTTEDHLDMTEDQSHVGESHLSTPPPPTPPVHFTRLRGKRGAGKSYRHVPHREKPPHLVARRNARERRRVQSVNVAFSRLRRVVPLAAGRSKRVSKVRVLENAITYISHLQALLRDRPASPPLPVCEAQDAAHLQQWQAVSTFTHL